MAARLSALRAGRTSPPRFFIFKAMTTEEVVKKKQKNQTVSKYMKQMKMSTDIRKK
jgi:hypothetical protein